MRLREVGSARTAGLLDAMIEKPGEAPLRGQDCTPGQAIQCERGGKSYWLFVIRYWGRRRRSQRSIVSGHWGRGRGRTPEGRGARVSKERGHLAHIFIVAGASCSRPSLERPAPCFAKPASLRGGGETEEARKENETGRSLKSNLFNGESQHPAGCVTHLAGHLFNNNTMYGPLVTKVPA